jgi:hypothetical protein
VQTGYVISISSYGFQLFKCPISSASLTASSAIPFAWRTLRLSDIADDLRSRSE